MTILCITNTMHDVRSCTIKGEHSVRCDGHEYQWSDEQGTEVTTGRACRGCLPRLAEHGMLCWSCWEKVQRAAEQWPQFRRLMLGVDRAVSPENGGIRASSSGYIPISGPQLAIDEIESFLPYDVFTAEGAPRSVRFARAVASAVRAHATTEQVHRIVRERCSECDQLSLVWYPTPVFGGDVKVKCSNPECGAVMDQSEFELTEPGLVVEAGQPVTRVFPEAYDPATPEHESFDPLSTRLLRELREQAEQLGVPRARQLRKRDLVAAIRAAEREESE